VSVCCLADLGYTQLMFTGTGHHQGEGAQPLGVVAFRTSSQVTAPSEKPSVSTLIVNSD